MARQKEPHYFAIKGDPIIPGFSRSRITGIVTIFLMSRREPDRDCLLRMSPADWRQLRDYLNSLEETEHL